MNEFQFPPPQAVEAEQSILGCCLVLGHHHGLELECFYRDSHRLIARAIGTLDQKGTKPDILAVADLLSSRNELEACGGASYLAELMTMPGSYENLPVYQRIVREAWIARKALMACSACIAEIYDRKGKAYHEIIQEHSRRLLDISDCTKEESSEVSIKDSCGVFIRDLEARMDGHEVVGHRTGWTEYDRLTGGLTPGELVILAGRPSMGKSCIAVNWIVNMGKRGVSSLLFSLESKHEKVTRRMIARDARVDANRIKAGTLNASEIERVYQSTQRIAELPILTIDSPESDIDIVVKAKRHKKQIVWIDYLGLVRASERNANRAVELAGITRRMKLLAMDMNVPVVLLAQLNREIERENRDPRLSDLRESGAIEQDADVVLFVHVDRSIDKNADHSSPYRKIILEKQREGGLGSWGMEFQGEYQHFQRPERG